MESNNLYHIPEDIRAEFRLDEEGRAFITLRGMSRLADVSAGGLVDSLKSGDQLKPNPLAAFLIQQGFGGDQLVSWRQTGIPDIAASLILEYFAYECLERYRKESAKIICRAFRATGIRAWLQAELGWSKPKTDIHQLSKLEMAKLQRDTLDAYIDAEEQRQLLQAKVEEDAPKVEFAEAILASNSCVSFSEFAKSVGIGRNNLFKWMRSKRIIQQNDTLPYQRLMNLDLFEVEQVVTGRGIKPAARLTPKGQLWLYKKLREDDAI